MKHFVCYWDVQKLIWCPLPTLNPNQAIKPAHAVCVWSYVVYLKLDFVPITSSYVSNRHLEKLNWFFMPTNYQFDNFNIYWWTIVIWKGEVICRGQFVRVGKGWLYFFLQSFFLLSFALFFPCFGFYFNFRPNYKNTPCGLG